MWTASQPPLPCGVHQHYTLLSLPCRAQCYFNRWLLACAPHCDLYHGSYSLCANCIVCHAPYFVFIYAEYDICHVCCTMTNQLFGYNLAELQTARQWFWMV